MMTGICRIKTSDLICLQTSYPLIFGIWTSRRTRSGGLLRSFSMASSPFVAVTTSYSTLWSASRNKVTMVSSSSATRITVLSACSMALLVKVVSEFVADTAKRLNPIFILQSQFFAQAANMHVDRPRRDIDRISPNALKQKFTRENAARVFHQHIKQIEFLRRQNNRFFFHLDGIGGQIEADVPLGDGLLRGSPLAAAQDRFHPGDQFLNFKGFGDVIVRSDVQRRDLSIELGISGDHDDGDVR